MFLKAHRLDRASFAAVFATGTRHHFPCHTLIVSPAPQVQAAVVVGKKVSKLAVQRNLIKRRIYARLRTELAMVTTPVAVIVLTKPCYAQLSRKAADESLRKSIAQVCKSA